MVNVDMSKSEKCGNAAAGGVNDNLPFYINDHEELGSDFVCLRVAANLSFSNIISADFSQNEQQLNEQFERIGNDLQSNMCFYIRSSNVMLAPANAAIKVHNNVVTCGDLLKNEHPTAASEHKSSSSAPSIKKNLRKYVPVDLVKRVTVDAGASETFSPVFTNHKGVCRLQTFDMPIDCLVLVEATSRVDNLYEIVLEKLNMHLQAIKQCYIDYYQSENDFKAQTYFYLLDGQHQQSTAQEEQQQQQKNQPPSTVSSNIILTCIYPSTKTDDDLVPLRKGIHRALDLSLNHPLLRRVDAVQLVGDVNDDDSGIDPLFANKLINPHLSAKPSNVANGKQSLVNGDYVYFHYMQDNINDNGWGCAYRSFQTIFSWFKLKSFTKKSVPTHRAIQQTLVNIGDKEKSFFGSSSWIGSMEISFCLSEMLNVDCKILSVSRGSELAEKAREIQHHFETEGSPIMIGGGVLAHTIIGVDFDEMTGEVKYLILDPHYTGSEDVKTITNKGWVAWKDVKFWNENSYYNLCCPIRPKGV